MQRELIKTMNENKTGTKEMLLATKIFLVILICAIGSSRTKMPLLYIFPLLEVIVIFAITALIAKRNKIVAYIFNSLMCLVVLMQQGILYYSGEYASEILLDNVESFSALGDSAIFFASLIIIVIIIALLPWRVPKWKIIDSKIKFKCILLLAIIYMVVLGTMMSMTRVTASPTFAFGDTVSTMISSQLKVARMRNSYDAGLNEKFYSEEIAQGIERDRALPERPNIILLFVEGMSAEVIDRYRPTEQVEGLVLTPNLNEFYDQSLVFENYTNHTAATYRGLWGQLFSGNIFQGGNTIDQMEAEEVGDVMKSNMIALPDVLSSSSYSTVMVNTEPGSYLFSAFVEELHFDKVVTDTTGPSLLSDKNAFELLYETIIDEEEPFFAAMYTVATHHGFDSPDAKYGDGSDAMLNKFYNYDEQFGAFFEKFAESDLADNTIIVLTTDHATFPSPEYISTFNSNAREFFGRIPLIIYWKGATHEVVDANGRNSLCLTPTILDLVDIDNHPNYFLGKSLFVEDPDNLIDNIGAMGDIYLTSDETYPMEKIKNNDPKYREAIKLIEEYYTMTLW